MCPFDEIKSWTCTACKFLKGILDPIPFNNTKAGTQGYTAYDSINNKIIVAIRGTHNTWNWFEDLDAIPVNYPNCDGCKVDQGFYGAYNSISDPLIAGVTTLYKKYNQPGIWVTAHSLGGAMLSYAALEIAERVAVPEVYYSLE